jgi:hypothetical protein
VMVTLEELGTPASSQSAVYNAIKRLHDGGTITKVDDGLYKLASRNGPSPDGRSGTTENQTTQPLSTVPGAEEAS